MACGCTTYQCLEFDYNPCSNGISLPINADATGNWSYHQEFNGAWNRLSMAVTNGQPIVIPNIVNEDYVHTIKIFNGSGELFNDTCYKLKTKVYTSATVTPSVSNDIKETYRKDITVTGSTMTITELIGAEILEVIIEQLEITLVSFDDATGEIEFDGNVGVDQTGYILYKK